MQIGEEQLAGPQARDFLRLRFLDLHHHLGAGEDLGGARDFSTGGAVISVMHADAGTGLRFDQDLMPVVDEFAHAAWGQADAVFVVFDFFRDTYQHGDSPANAALE